MMHQRIMSLRAMARHSVNLGMASVSLLCAACGASPEPDWEADVETREQDLQNSQGQNPFSAFSTVVAYDGNVGVTSSLDPAVCWKKQGYVVLYRNSSNKIAMLATDTTGAPPALNGGDYRSSLPYQWKGISNFNSRPACVNLDPVDTNTNPAYKMVVAGRTTNNKFAVTKSVQVADVGSAHLATPSPEETNPWSHVSDDTYAGGPALAAGKGKVVISGIRASDKRLISYTRSLSNFDSGSWSGPYEAGVLPAGWTATGTPAIAMTGAGVNTFTVVVRATNGSQSKFFFTYFGGTGYGVILPDHWIDLSVTNPSSDPALQFSTIGDSSIVPDTLTLTYRRSGSLYQTSGLDQGLAAGTKHNIGSTFVGSPAIKGVRKSIEGEYLHTIVGRRSDGKLSVSFVEISDLPLAP
jgi:hypothetical protein